MLEEGFELGTIISNHEGPSHQKFQFIISNDFVRENIENGYFVEVTNGDETVLGQIQGLIRTNRYFSSADTIHGSASLGPITSVYPADRWDYLIAEVKVLGSYRGKSKNRATKPVVPGSMVRISSDKTLRNFLGFDDHGLKLGKIRQSSENIGINLDRIMQKHLAILSISGGGKSYTSSVLIEELLGRGIDQGRPCVILFDVHGEYQELNSINKNKKFSHTRVAKIDGSKLSLALGYLSATDFRKFFPAISPAQTRELNRILVKLNRSKKPYSIETIIEEVLNQEMNQLIKEALLSWMYLLKNTKMFGNSESPDLQNLIEPGTLLLFDLSSITSLWKKQVILHYFLTRIFELRRAREIPPVVSFIEEAHQFAPEKESSVSKSIIHTIAREGRKFMCSLVLISQRPINLSATALSQCNTHLILRIMNPNDLAWIGKTSEGINQETLGMITTLGVGEGLLAGEAVNYPIFIKIREKMTKSVFDNASIAKETLKFEKIKLAQNIK